MTFLQLDDVHNLFDCCTGLLECFLLVGCQVDFGVTISFVDEHLRCHWEPDAAPISKRAEALRLAKSEGLSTWVSVDPIIEADEALRVIRSLAPFVDVWKIGKLMIMKQMGMIMMAFGFFFCHAQASTLLGRSVKKGKGSAQALYNLFYYTGASVGVFFIDPFYLRWGWQGVITCTSIALVFCLGVIAIYHLKFAEHHKRTTPLGLP